jgi:hypothetical protein
MQQIRIERAKIRRDYDLTPDRDEVKEVRELIIRAKKAKEAK